MANELTINLTTISYVKGTIGINIAPAPAPATVTVTGTHTVHDQLVLSTSDSNITKGNIGTIGWIYVKNLDTTNNIIIGTDGSLYPLLFKPGEYGVFRWNGAAFHAKAVAGTPIIEYMIIED
jgi:hypothetical protein